MTILSVLLLAALACQCEDTGTAPAVPAAQEPIELLQSMSGCSMSFAVTMGDSASVGHPACTRLELQMSEGRITGIRIWPLGGEAYEMRVPDQDSIRTISSTINPISPRWQ
jgi:hypothetical protein